MLYQAPFWYLDEAKREQYIHQLGIKYCAPLERVSVRFSLVKAIPYPLILIFTHADMLALNVTDKRISQTDKSKWVVEEGWMTHWFNPSAPTKIEQQFMADIVIKNLSFLNFYTFYLDIKNYVIALNSAQRSGSYTITTKAKSNARLKTLKRIDELENEMAEWRSSLKKETQFNTKLKLNVAAKEYQDTIKQLEQKL